MTKTKLTWRGKQLKAWRDKNGTKRGETHRVA